MKTNKNGRYWPWMGALILAFAMGPATVVADHGSDGGNGGIFKRMQFISLGYEGLDIMTILHKRGWLSEDINLHKYAEVLRTMDVKFQDEVLLREEPHSGANYPAENKVYMKNSDWERHQDQPEELLTMTLHETLPLAGVDDTNHTVSIPIVREARRLGLLDRLHLGHESFADQPVLLFAEHWDDVKSGMSYRTAQEICRTYKQMYSDQYFFVYCEYLEKSWHETVKKVYPAKTYQEYVNRYHREIIIDRYWEEHDVSVEKTTYGLRVYGWALLSKAPWRPIASSLGLGGGLIDRTFESPNSAYAACRERVNAAIKSSTEFYRAICRTPEIDDPVSGQIRYYYEIVTQNPLVN